MSDRPADTPEFTAGWNAMRKACFDAGMFTWDHNGFFRVRDQNVLAEFLRGARRFADVLDREQEEQT